MATVTLTRLFQRLNEAPGDLFRATEDTRVGLRSATQFNFRHEDGSTFEGFRVLVAGTGFTYNSGVPTGGAISSITIVNPAGQTVATLSGLSVASGTKSLEEFYARAFGASDGPRAWSYLLTGNDVIDGSTGTDWRWPAGTNSGNDTYYGRQGDDAFDWETGNDRYYGSSGYDELSHSRMSLAPGQTPVKGVTINVTSQTVVDPWGATDRFRNIEAFEGSRYGDRYEGANYFWDRFSGLAGRDVIDGGANSFDVAGQRTGDNSDMALYRQDFWHGGRRGIVADLETSFVGGSIRGTIKDGFGNIDTVIDIEGVGGTRYGDSFTGSRLDNWFVGGEGRDTYVGGGGRDTIVFEEWFGTRAPTGVNVDLRRSTGQVINDGFGNTETTRGIENVKGTWVKDTLRGNWAANEIEGGDGTDTLTGRGGADTFIFRDRTAIGDRDRITDFSSADDLAFQVGNFAGMTDTVRLVNGTAARTAQGTFLFNAANDTLTWDSNGTGAGGQTVVAILTGVNSLSVSNFDLWT